MAAKAVVEVVASDKTGTPITQGSGFLVSRDGKLLTNLHVLKGAASAVAKFPDGAFYQIEGVLGVDANRDIVALKIQATDKEFPFLPLADVARAEVGERVVAIGSPLGLEGTVSDGIISAVRDAKELDSQLPFDYKVLQITVPVSHGSSGGPLLTLQGEVIGITTFGFLGGQNLNFAVPASYAQPLLSVEQPRPLTELMTPPSENVQHGREQIAGTYLGVWQSKSGSGAVALTVTVENGVLRVNALITGSPVGYKGDSMVGSNLRELGNGVWTVELMAEHSRLSANGIFKAGTFVGDFNFRYGLFRIPDRGQWILTKQ